MNNIIELKNPEIDAISGGKQYNPKEEAPYLTFIVIILNPIVVDEFRAQ